MPAGCFAGAVEQPQPALGGVVEGAAVAAATQAAARGVTGEKPARRSPVSGSASRVWSWKLSSKPQNCESRAVVEARRLSIRRGMQVKLRLRTSAQIGGFVRGYRHMVGHSL